MRFNSREDGYLFEIYGTERMRINADGKVIIKGNLQVDGDINNVPSTAQIGTDTVESDNIKNGTIVNVDISDHAAIAGSKINPDFGAQNISTTGNVGIGTDDPKAKLTIKNGAPAHEIIKVFADSQLYAGVGVDGNGAILTAGSSSSVNSPMIFRTAHNGDEEERMRITADGKVGIGVVPQVDWNTERPALQLAASGSISGKTTINNSQMAVSANAKQVETSNDDGWEYIHNGYASQYLQFNGGHQFRVATSSDSPDSAINWTEAMTIDNDGNAIFGKTTANNTTVGTTIYNDNGASIVRDANPTLIHNRLNSDGEIVEFRKDGTTVGSIGRSNVTEYKRGLYISGDDVGFSFEGHTNNAITPYSIDTGDRDNKVSLGATSSRFKSLYLSDKAFAPAFGNSADTDTSIRMPGSDIMQFYTNDTERMRIDANGNVGIGTDNPRSPLHIYKNIDGTTHQSDFGRVAGSIALSLSNEFSSPNTAVSLRFAPGEIGSFARGSLISSLLDGDNGSDLQFWTVPDGSSPKESMRIDADGKVGIGTDNPQAKLQVMGTVMSNSTTLTSDQRWKKDITTLDNSLDKIAALRGVSYEWKRNEFPDKNFSEGTQIGVIAQEIESVFPELVSEDNEGYKSVSYSNLVAPLIEAVKELKQQNETLNNRVEALEKQQQNLIERLEALENK
jgi:hypothetical protein